MVSWAWLTEWNEGQSWQPKFGPGPEIWSQRSPGRIPASLSLAARDLLDVGPAKSLQGARNLDGNFSCTSLGGHQALCRFFDRMHKKPFFPYHLHISFSLSPLSCLIVLHVSVLAIPALSPLD